MTAQLQDAIVHDVDVAESIPNLNLTTPRYRLKKGEASIILGLDVIEPGHFRPDRGRKPLGATVPTADLPLTMVEGVDADALVTVRVTGVALTHTYNVGPDPITGEPDLSQSPVRYRSTTGQWLDTGEYGDLGGGTLFAFYRARIGDRIAVHRPFRFAGYYPVLAGPSSGNAPDAILLNPPPGGVTLTGVDAVIAQGRGYFLVSGVLPSGTTSTMLVKTPDEYDATGPWPEDILGVHLTHNEDERLGTQTQVTVYRVDPLDPDAGAAPVTKWAMPGDALMLEGGEVFSKFTVNIARRSSMRGILLSNGRKFWVLEEAGLRLVLDLGDDALLGSKWRTARIANNRFLLVTEGFAPRVLHLYRNSTDGDEDALAGLISPRHPNERYNSRTEAIEANSSWGATAIGSGGAMDAGTIRVLVRAINLEDNLVSDFVAVALGGSAVIPTSAGSATIVTVIGNDRVSVYNAACEASNWAAYVSPRMTHIEVWRTQAAATPPDVYYLESRIAIADFSGNESHKRQRHTWVAPDLVLSSADSPRNVANSAFPYPIALSNTNLARRTIQVAADVLAGGLPPICRDVVSLGGVTLCFGKAAVGRVNQTVMVRDFGFWNADFLAATSDLYVGAIDTVDGLANYTFQVGDILEVTDGGQQLGVARNGEFNDGTTFMTLGANWTRDATKKLLIATAATSAVTWTNVLTVGVPYVVQVTIRSITPGGSVWFKGGTPTSASWTTAGTFHDVITPDGTDLELHGDSLTAEVDVVFAARVGDLGAFNDVLVPKPGLTPGRYAIASKVSDTTLRLEDTGLVPENLRGVKCHILRPFEIRYPAIESDEDVWYSRTDLFGPENFPPQVLSLSKRGDVFRRAVVVGNLAVAVMDQGVHLIYRSGSILAKETVGETGLGTPWADSVIVIGRTVYWATALGFRGLSVSDDPDQAGLRGRSAYLTPPELSRWFQDAFRAGDTIDSGYDPTWQAIRVRRTAVSGVVQTLQYGLRTEKWTLLDDDTGQRYATARLGDEPLLYSVENESGGVFCCNPLDRETSGFPYGDAIVQDTADESYQVRRTSLKRLGAFSPLMVGESIRFPDLDAVRVILTATDDLITFGDVPSISTGVRFIIGAMRVEYLASGIDGEDRDAVKTLHALNARMRSGPRGVSEGELIVRVVADFKVETDEAAPIGDDLADSERALSIESQGSAIEIGLQCFDARTDFEVEQLRAEVREEPARV